VAGGDHHPAGGLEVIGLEIDFLGAAQADVDDLAAFAAQADRQRVLQGGAGQAHVVAQHHRPGAQHVGQGHADAAGQVLVQFVGDAATDVVGLECGKRHGGSPCVRGAGPASVAKPMASGR
jgi:hypothetical protein